MARPEWLRTFLAVYRAESVTEGARLRALSQPAASQQLAQLERAVGGPLFVRGPSGVQPTPRGRALYGEVAGALDQLEAVLAGLDAGRVVAADPPLRLGCSAEHLSALVVPRLGGVAPRVVARFASDAELVDQVAHGELDVAVTSSAPARRAITTERMGEGGFVLVAPPRLAPPRRHRSLAALGSWLGARPWVAYSQELPVTRRFWQTHLGRPFPSANLRLVAPDLRVVASAVAAGLGCSLLPAFACAEHLSHGRMHELYPLDGLVAPQAWYLCWRDGEGARPGLASLVAALTGSTTAGPGTGSTTAGPGTGGTSG